MSEKNWFLIQFKPKSHFIAQHNLKRQGFETFLPLEKLINKNKKYLYPLFPSYMFVNIPNACNSWRKINSTIGVLKLVSFGTLPKPINSNLVSDIMNQCDTSGVLLPNKKFKTGDTIKVVNSPFVDFFATIESIDSNKRVWVLIEIMGRYSRINLSQENVQLY
jgi:transcriptional antiterminator RfaH